MKYSILTKNPEKKKVACDVLYDLSLDRAASRLISDQKRREYFLSVLSDPLTDPENIVFRQQIYTDLASIPGLLDDLKVVFGRYDKIRSDWNELRLNAAPVSNTSVDPQTLLEHIFASLKVTAIFPGTISSYYASIRDTLAKYPVKSEGLTAIRDYCTEMTKNKSLSELVDIAQLFRYNTPDDFDFEISAALDRTLRFSECGLSLISPHKEQQTNVLSQLFHRKKEDDGVIDLVEPPPQTKEARHAKQSEPATDELTYDNSVFLQSEALLRIDNALAKVTGDVYETFCGLSRELMFYEAAISVTSAVKEAGLPLSLPSILPPEAECFSAEGLRDLFLVCSGKDSDTIVPNDLSVPKDKKGMLIKGMTDSGKTVFLRSAATAYLFAQSGLPVIAEKAQFSVRNGFFSHFSSAEEEFFSGDIAGRFESEAREVSEILSQLTPHSLIFFNETFQTTSYGEGTDGMAGILRILEKLGTKYIFVTHLTALFNVMREDEIIRASTSEDKDKKYKVLTI